jgi:CRP-like cAMP-binding protein
MVQEIIYVTQKDTLGPMFQNFKSENMLKDLSFMMKNSIYMPGDYIIVKDQPADEMYFIKEGSVNVIGSDKSTILKTLVKGEYFGEIGIFMKTNRIAYVQARTECVIGILLKSDIDSIMISYPKLGI